MLEDKLGDIEDDDVEDMTVGEVLAEVGIDADMIKDEIREIANMKRADQMRERLKNVIKTIETPLREVVDDG